MDDFSSCCPYLHSARLFPNALQSADLVLHVGGLAISCSSFSIIHTIDTGVLACEQFCRQQKRIGATRLRWQQIWSADTFPLFEIIARTRFLLGNGSVLVLWFRTGKTIYKNHIFSFPKGPTRGPVRRGFFPVLALLDHLPSQQSSISRCNRPHVHINRTWPSLQAKPEYTSQVLGICGQEKEGTRGSSC